MRTGFSNQLKGLLSSSLIRKVMLTFSTGLPIKMHRPEKWAAMLVVFGSALLNEEEPLDDELRQVVLWRLAKCRTMLMFTRNLEELAWRGYRNFGADTLAEALTAWELSDKTETEEHWQTFLQDRPYLISLISPGPVAVHAGKAFLGGKKVDNTGGKIVDFLLEHSIGGNAALLG